MTVSVPRIEKLLAEATERPWSFSGRAYDYDENVAIFGSDGEALIESGCRDENRLRIEDEDAALICEAVNALQALIAAVKALNEAVILYSHPDRTEEENAEIHRRAIRAREALAPFSFEEQA